MNTTESLPPKDLRAEVKARLHPLIRDLAAAGVSEALLDRVGELVWDVAIKAHDRGKAGR